MLIRRSNYNSVLALLTLAISACSSEDRVPPEEKIRPKVTSFTANPMTVAGGATTMLSWQVEDATSLSIDIQGGANIQPDTDQLMGTVTTPPLTADTTFVLKAVNGDQTTTAMVIVTIDGQMTTRAVIGAFAATPMSVAAGGSTTLSWQTSMAVSGVIRSGGADVLVLSAENLASGTHVIPSLTAPATYTLAVKGSDEFEVTRDVTVSIDIAPMPSVTSFTAGPASITAGMQSTLAWVVTNANSVVVTGPVSGQVYSGANLTGSVTVMPSQTETFTLVASDGTRTAMQMVTVTVTTPMGATILNFTASPTTVALGTQSTLAWQVMNAPGGIEISDGTAIVTNSAMASGSFQVTPAVTTTYTLRAISPVMDATQSVTVTVNPAAPAIVYFHASQDLVARNATTVLAWRTIGATSLRILANGTEIHTATMGLDMGMYTATVTDLLTRYVLEVTNATGTNTFTITVVAHDPPVINSFTATPPAFSGMANITLAWSVASANELELLANGAAATGFVPVDTGTTAGALNGMFTIAISADTTFELVARSAAGEVRQSVVVASAVAELEPNDAAGQAQPLPGGGVTAGINPAGDVDWFAIAVPAGGYIVAETSDGAGGCTTDTFMDFLAPDATTILASNDDVNFPANPCSMIDGHTVIAASDLAAGTYYLRIRGYDAMVSGSYTLSVVAYPPACGNAIPERNGPAPEQCDDGNLVAGDGCSATCTIEPIGVFTAPGPDVTLPGAITPAGDVDFFQITVTSTVYLEAETFAPTAAMGTCTGADTVIYLLDSAFTVLGDDDESGIDSCSRFDAYAPFARVGPGTYYLAVVDYFGGEIPAYEVVFHAVNADVCGNGITELDAGEQCDDGNSTPGDGCTAMCGIEVNPTIINYPGGTVTVSLPSATSFAVIQIETGAAGRAVSAIAADAGGATCNTIDTAMNFGNAAFELLGTAIDNGPTGTAGECAAILYPADDYAANLQLGTYYLAIFSEDGATGSVQVSVTIHNPVCGNGINETNGTETCDDGNTTSGDGCSAACAIELPVVEEAEANNTPATYQDWGTITFPAVFRAHGALTPATDRDFFRFTITEAASVLMGTHTTANVFTSCTDDTQLWIYNGAPTDLDATTATLEPTLVAYDDDDGFGNCSWINGFYNAPVRLALPAGTYYVQARTYNNLTAMPSYYITFDLQ